MTLEQAVNTDRVVENISAKDLANYLVNNFGKYSDELIFNLEVELQEYIQEHSNQTYMEF